MMDFDDPDLGRLLEGASDTDLDGEDFGVVRMDRSGAVAFYNRYESDLSGLSPERVVGRHFFEDVAPCTNNFMVAERFAEESLDEQLDYVFTYRMRPTKVRLRLLKPLVGVYQYLLVRRR